MNNRSQIKQEKIDRILDYGIEAFRQHGYHSSSVQDLADFCQISKGSFYQYFASKEDFCQAVIKHYSQKINTIANSFFNDKSVSGLNRLIKFYAAKIEAVKESDFKSGCLYGDLAAELGGVNKLCSDTISSCLAKSSTIFVKIIEEGQEDGSIRKDIDSVTLSSISFSCFTGIILRMKVERSTQAGEEFINSYVKKLLSPI